MIKGGLCISDGGSRHGARVVDQHARSGGQPGIVPAGKVSLKKQAIISEK